MSAVWPRPRVCRPASTGGGGRDGHPALLHPRLLVLLRVGGAGRGAGLRPAGGGGRGRPRLRGGGGAQQAGHCRSVERCTAAISWDLITPNGRVMVQKLLANIIYWMQSSAAEPLPIQLADLLYPGNAMVCQLTSRAWRRGTTAPGPA